MDSMFGMTQDAFELQVIKDLDKLWNNEEKRFLLPYKSGPLTLSFHLDPSLHGIIKVFLSFQKAVGLPFIVVAAMDSDPSEDAKQEYFRIAAHGLVVELCTRGYSFIEER